MLHRLQSLCKVAEHDSDSVREMKSAFRASVDEKYFIHHIHKLATVVCPSFKHLTFVNSDEREEVYTQLRCKIDSLPNLPSFASEDSEFSDSAQEPSTKKIEVDDEADLLSEYKQHLSVQM